MMIYSRSDLKIKQLKKKMTGSFKSGPVKFNLLQIMDYQIKNEIFTCLFIYKMYLSVCINL